MKSNKIDFEFELLNKEEQQLFYSELECISFGTSFCYYDKLFDLCLKYKLYFLLYPDGHIIISDSWYGLI